VTAGLQIVPAPGQPDIDRIYEALRKNRAAVAGTTAAQRIARIRRLEDAVMARRAEIHAALWSDYRKSSAEVDLSEIYPVLGEARHARRHLNRWMRPRRVGTPLALFGSRSRILHEPKGVVLILSPWNFPVNLTFGPLVSAIAAGNCVMIKPSELTPHASACMKRIVSDLFDENEVALIEGDSAVAGQLLARKFDHIFFTGSPRVGRIVMKAAAEHLTSVTLELGGKSPVIVDRTADLDEAAKKIAWGKSFNSGQVCIAPDYLLVDESVRPQFTSKLRAALDALGGASRSDVVNDSHAARIHGLLDQAVRDGAEVIAGGTGQGRTLEPTLVSGMTTDSPLMREEIFGPLLPMIGYTSIDEALALIGEREKPLVLYVFSRDAAFVDGVVARTSAGGTVINDTLIHFYQIELPFGGVGESGMGRAHGQFGFEAFSNVRGILEQPTRFSAIQLMYPPYTALKQKLIDLTLRYF
jgi:aldehyde dehydrogenase (NAD+)